MKNRIITRFLASLELVALMVPLLAPSAALFAEDKITSARDVSYKAIGDLYLPSFGIVEVEEDKRSGERFDLRRFNFNVPRLDENQTRIQLYNLFDSYDQARSILDFPADFDHFNMAVLIKDLELFFGQGSEPRQHLLSRFGDTVTFSGEVVRTKMLATPLSNKEILLKRQKAIKAFLESPELSDQVEEHLKEIRASEQAFMSFWHPNEDALRKIKKRVYWSIFEEWNDNPVALEVLTRLENLNTLFFKMTRIPMSMAFWWLGHKVEEAKDLQGNPVSFGTEIVNHFSNWKTRLLGGKDALGREQPVKYWLWGVLGLMLLGDALTLKNGLNEAALTRDAINYLHNQMIEVAHIVRNAKDLLTVAKKSELLNDGWVRLKQLEEVFARAESPDTDFDHLIADLQTDTFRPPASFFSVTGRVLANFTRMAKCKEQMVILLEAVGELDSYLSFAKLMKKHQNERVGYCFANYVDGSKPYLKVESYWHPMIDVNKVVTNDLMMGGVLPESIVLTGSNTGGKSTILKSLLLSILMAQTFGIAPAKEITLAPYHYLGCYLHVQDDVAAGNSLFKAEVLRAQSMVEHVRSLKDGEFAFLVIDELFTGTAPTEGQAAAYKIAEHLLANAHTSFILATHFPELTKLEAAYPQECRNFKIDIFKDSAGNLVRTFRMEPGISTQNVAKDILQEEIGDINFRGNKQQPQPVSATA